MDLNNDGHLDILSGSWPGELYLFQGGPNQSFAAPIMLRDKQDQIINIGGGVVETDEHILIKGHVEWKETEDGHVAIYQGKQIKGTAEKSLASTGTASTVCVADWDGDGDCDLIVGNSDGEIHWIPNQGTPEAYAWGASQQLEANGHPLRVASGRAGPCVADWDGDGDLDLLAGAENGSVTLYTNRGTRTQPKLDRGHELVSPGHASFGSNAPKEPRRGQRAKICVADWNGDGKLDLLLGDMATLKPDLPPPTPKQEAEYAKISQELEPLTQTFSTLAQKLHGPSRPDKKDELKKLQEEFSQTLRKMQDLRSQLPKEYETHGWVWLFIRQS